VAVILPVAGPSPAPVVPSVIAPTTGRESTAKGAAPRVEVTVSVPIGVSARLSIEVGHLGGVSAAPEPARFQADAGRLGGILAITASPALERNIGAQEARQALDAITALGAETFDLPPGIGVKEATAATRDRLAARDCRGVLVVGGYDVVPAAIIDTLPPELHARFSDTDDPDDFTVWSDELYGDIDGDGVAELPVSRLPDTRSAALRCAPARGSPGPACPFGRVAQLRPALRRPRLRPAAGSGSDARLAPYPGSIAVVSVERGPDLPDAPWRLGGGRRLRR
jgi:hypothetical protein